MSYWYLTAFGAVSYFFVPSEIVSATVFCSGNNQRLFELQLFYSGPTGEDCGGGVQAFQPSAGPACQGQVYSPSRRKVRRYLPEPCLFVGKYTPLLSFLILFFGGRGVLKQKLSKEQ